MASLRDLHLESSLTVGDSPAAAAAAAPPVAALETGPTPLHDEVVGDVDDTILDVESRNSGARSVRSVRTLPGRCHPPKPSAAAARGAL